MLCQALGINTQVGGNFLALTRRNSLPCKVWNSRQEQGLQKLVVCQFLFYLIFRVFGEQRRDQATLSYPWLLDLTLECHGQQPRPYNVVNMQIGYPFMIIFFGKISPPTRRMRLLLFQGNPFANSIQYTTFFVFRSEGHATKYVLIYWKKS